MNTNTIKKIKSFALLARGWDLDEGIPASAEAVDKALSILEKYGKKHVKTFATPTSDGGVTISFSRRGQARFHDVTVNGDLSLSYRMEVGVGTNFDVLDDRDGVTDGFIESILTKI